jgi:alpha-L-rhamnosidase
MTQTACRTGLLAGLAIGLLTLPCHGAAQDCSITPVDLRCEYLQNPLGIDTLAPRLSWKLSASDPQARGLRQAAYRVLVASSPSKLARHEGDLWDSGQVESGQSIHVVYQGKTLGAGMACHWKVQVRDQDGTLSAWSEPGQWTMGLLAASDWRAKWIGSDRQFSEIKALPPTGDYLADPWFRKTFTLRDTPRHATLYVASVGYHELYVNGAKVTDVVLMPSVSDHTKRARYVTYDITEYLQRGPNVIGLWLGTAWSVFPLYKTPDKPQTPIVLAQAEMLMPDGRVQRVVTDGTWKTHPSPSALLGTWMFMHYGGEYYDAAKEVPDWCHVTLDDRRWKSATVYHPNLTVSAEVLEPNRRVKRISPVAVEEIQDTGYRVDMGTNFAGMVEVDLTGTPGNLIEIQCSENPNKMMTHGLRSLYRIGPRGRGTFRNRFNYGSGRWLLIKGLTSPPERHDVRGYLVRTDFARTGWFESSNTLLNRIYDITLWTFENLSLGGYVVDCPQRERMGYGGDAHATTQTALNSYGLGAFYTKWSQDWRDVQGKETAWGLGDKSTAQQAAESGNLPYTAPTYWGGGGPAWSGYCVTLPWLMYQYCGDTRILAVNFNTIQRWLAFLETKAKDDMLVRWGGKWDFLGDWLWPGAQGVNGDTPETLFFNNCYWIYNLQTAARIAEVLGETDEATAYWRRARRVARAVHETFYDPAEQGYVSNLQAYLACALLVGVPPKDLEPAVWQRFEQEILEYRNGHFWAGITGGYFVVKAMLDFDRPDLMYTMATKDTYPGWGDMLKRDATTLWESWEGKKSLLHSSYLHIGAWFMEGLAGIRPDPRQPGYRHFILKPGVLKDRDLDWVKARLDTPHGLIRSAWRVQDRQLHVQVTVPPNTTATLHLPTSDAGSLQESQAPVTLGRGVTSVQRLEGRAVLELASGRYHFTATP